MLCRDAVLIFCLVFHLKACICYGQDCRRTVAAIGDSLTVGYNAAHPGGGPSCGGVFPTAYPTVLQAQLGPSFNVTNLGKCGTTLQINTDKSWWTTSQFNTLVTSAWDVVVIMLGTNDALIEFWDHACDENSTGASCPFFANYETLLSTVRTLGRSYEVPPEIFLVVPPPVTMVEGYGIENMIAINSIIPRLVPKIAAANGIPPDHVLDMFTALGGAAMDEFVHQNGCVPDYPNCAYMCDHLALCDQLHPSDAGYVQIATAVSGAIMQLPPWFCVGDETLSMKMLQGPSQLQPHPEHLLQASLALIGGCLALAMVIGMLSLRRLCTSHSQANGLTIDDCTGCNDASTLMLIDGASGDSNCEDSEAP